MVRHDELKRGDRFGRFEIEGTLGSGAMGTVYKAIDGGVVLALKLVRPELLTDAVLRRRFAREARVASEIEHPNVVGVVAFGEENDVPYIAQRFVPRGSLAAMLDARGALAPAETARLIVDVACGLEEFQSRELIHRDLKPANILIDQDGTAMIADFGLTKDRKGTILTRPGTALGTSGYMAPEQIRNESIDGRADIYSLGCVAWECAFGRRLFHQLTGMAEMFAHLRDQPELPPPGENPSWLVDLIVAMVGKEADQRPPNAGQLRELALKGEVGVARASPVIATRPSLLYEDSRGKTRVFELPESGGVTIGRDPYNDLVIGWDDEISRLHTRLEPMADGWTVLDEGLSRNGTFLNDVRVDGRRALSEGDRIQIGQTELVVHLGRGSALAETSVSLRRVE